MKHSLLWLSLLPCWAGVAHADVPPPAGYVEQCTLEKQKKAGEDCQTSRPWHGDPDKGDLEWGAKGYKQRCRTNGASAWTEIWCKAADPVKPPEPATVAAEPAKPPEPTTTPSTPAAAAVAAAGGTAPQPAPSAPPASESAAAQGEAVPGKSRGCSMGSGDTAGSWLIGLALLAVFARRRESRRAHLAVP